MAIHLKNSLYPKIIQPENLLKAFEQACYEKRYRADVLIFKQNLGMNILALRQSLLNKTYQPGKYHFFQVYDPKFRQIAAAPFIDRIVHHAVCRIIEPIFDSKFIYDTLACRREKGTHHGVKRLQKFLRKQGTNYALKCDISKYFSSINHQILINILVKTIPDQDTLWLLEKIISSYESGNEYNELFPENSYYRTKKPRGIPIGNLTSQLFANVYLNKFDQFVKEKLKAKYYLRYVDDFLILGQDKQYLGNLIPPLKEFLKEKLYLTLHPKKIRIYPVEIGVDFLGFIIFKDFKLVRARNIRKFRKRLKRFQKLLIAEKITEKRVCVSITCWLAHAEHGDSYRLRKSIFGAPLTAKNQKGIAEFVKELKCKAKTKTFGARQLKLF
jgi:retron-type reverse transcriptase